ncbi:MAG: YchF-related putative GTPase [Candidatus Methanosuratincola verstraetei]|jgi:ribosome-binding ATPase YchF (GTP1/OBG family)|uniref:Redox-regulated ATPase YchF n=2 Tax=Candidatus Methanosuratincola (ex Vanwonterghem et al. 2016) TaxID=1915412 RepID=A0A7J3UZJ7_9CREN|nr:MAG: GTP-binding and nucleic acid-binding protein YchF [Candidatus Methanosuratincola subterraneus]
MVRIGIIGKTNAGKTTLFNAITMMNAEVSNYPFTTKEPNVGIGYVKTACVCKELGVKDNPQNSVCIDGWRFIPIEVVDLPGLIKGASEGLGLGTRFLSVAAQADVILHVVDASGSINANGEICEPGLGSPLADYYDIEEELVKWYTKNLLENADKVRRAIQNKAVTLAAALYDILSGIKVTYPQIKEALSKTRLEGVPFEDWEEEEFRAFATEIRYLSKPTLIVANKMDMPVAEKNLAGLVETFGRSFVIPVSAEVELLLRRAEKAGAISYTPGDEKFVVKDASKLTPKQKWALEYVQSRIFDKWLRTGVDLAVTTAVLKLLRVNVVYPVEDAKKYSDRKGNVLPDAYLMPQGSTPKDLARQIHSELYDNFLYAIDSVSGIRLPNNYELRDRDVITIVTTRKRKT